MRRVDIASTGMKPDGRHRVKNDFARIRCASAAVVRRCAASLLRHAAGVLRSANSDAAHARAPAGNARAGAEISLCEVLWICG